MSGPDLVSDAAAVPSHGVVPGTVWLLPVRGLPEVRAGDDLAEVIASAVALADGDVVVVAQKVVSKAEGAVVTVGDGEDVEAVRARLTRELADRVVVDAPGVLVVRTHHGLVCANAGIDASNAAPGRLVLLPDDPDASAHRIRRRLGAVTGARVAVVVTDTFGRAWRHGQTDIAIGSAGIAPIRDERSPVDRAGRRLDVTEVAVVDEIAAAADLVRRKAEGVPVVVVRGLDWDPDDRGGARDLVRDAATDLFPRGRGALAAALEAPEALRPLDMAALRQAYDTVSTLAGEGVHFSVESTHDAIITRPRAVESPSAQSPSAQHLTTLGAAAALLFAVLVDAGYAVRLVTEPEPAVIAETPASQRHDSAPPTPTADDGRGTT